ncbi:hypothetical protein [Pantoea vagans]|uniref:hypothetical protein n=1 Tax=Pantoea vagans TaxID=470934 RepID=UPI00301A9BE3
MNKLTAEKCREMFLHLLEEKRQDGITLKEDLYMQALEIALPILEQQERGEWIEWGGGERPVNPVTMVEVKIKSGKILPPEIATYWDWSNKNLIAYRIIPERATNQNGEQ